MKPTFAFQWHITDACDQRCKHCYIFSENNQKKIESMTWEQIQKTFANCLEFCEKFNRTPHFYITGGDPILHKNFWQLLELLHEKNFPFTIMGNPFHLTEKICKKLKSLGCKKYQMSLDGLKDTHDFFRKPGSFDETLKKIPVIKNAKIRAAIMTTVSAKNISEIPALIDKIAGVADIFAFARYCPTSEEKSAGIAPLEYRNFLKICHEKFTKLEAEGCETYFNRKDHLWTLFEFEEKIFKIPENVEENMIYGGCSCGNSHITILPSGDVLACRRVRDSKVGNVFEKNLSEIWLNEMEKYRAFEKFKKCSRCELWSFCRGCPATAKNFYAEDPQCWKKI